MVRTKSAVEAAKRRARAAGENRSLRSSNKRLAPGHQSSLSKTNSRDQLFSVFSKRTGIPNPSHSVPRDDNKENETASFAKSEEFFPQNSFFFQQRHGKLDLRAISRVDIEKIIETVDIDTIQSYLENLTFSELDEADLRNYTDESFLKLFQLTQLTIEYLLNVQHTLFAYVSKLEGKMTMVSQEQNIAKTKMVEQGEQLKSLKRELRQKKRTLRTYEFLLTQQSANSSRNLLDEKHKVEVASDALDRQTEIQKSLKEVKERLEIEENNRLMKDRDLNRQLKQEEKSELLKLLETHMEATKKELLDHLEKEKEDMRNREKMIEDSSLALQARLNEKIVELSVKGSDNNKKNNKQFVSLAGELEDDEITMSVNTILNNDKLAKSKLNSFTEEERELQKTTKGESEIMEGSALAQQQNAEGGEQTLNPKKNRNHEKSDTQTESQILEPEKEKEQDNDLMLVLANSKVKSSTLNARNLQLRRVLRMVRKKVQQRSFVSWILFTIKENDTIRRNNEEVEERIRKKIKEVNYEESEEFFKPTYEWQKAPEDIQSYSPPLENKDGMVRIPRSFKCKIEVYKSKNKEKASKIVTFDAERNMTIFDCRVLLKHILKEPLESISLCRNSSDPPLPDVLSVEAAEFFLRQPVVVITEKLSDDIVNEIVERYTTQMNDETTQIEEKLTKESIRIALQSELDNTMQSLNLSEESPHSSKSSKSRKTEDFRSKASAGSKVTVDTSKKNQRELIRARREARLLEKRSKVLQKSYRQKAQEFLTVNIDDNLVQHLALDSGMSNTVTSSSSGGIPTPLDSVENDQSSHFDISARADEYELHTPYSVTEDSIQSPDSIKSEVGTEKSLRKQEISKLLSAIESDEDSEAED